MHTWHTLITLGLIATADLDSSGQSGSAPEGQFRFREPLPQSYRLEQETDIQSAGGIDRAWVKAWPERAPRQPVLLGARVVLKLSSDARLQEILSGSRLHWARTRGEGIYILQGPNARIAAEEAQRLGNLPGVEACYPVRRVKVALQGPYAVKPNDPYYIYQWYLENRGIDTQLRGPDINARAAWPFATGKGIEVAVADDGVEFAHPELGPQEDPALNFNFITGQTNGVPPITEGKHGTAVAGLIAASGNNQLGMTGIAYQARLAGWIIRGADGYLVDDEQMADMFEHASSRVDVQNHSWGNATENQLGPSLLQLMAITNAALLGRSGKGVIMVHASGNQRTNAVNANDDGYVSNPLGVTVAAVRTDGRAAGYSTPGACILVAAPSGDKSEGFPTLFTTDRMGLNGYNQAIYTNDFANYGFDATGFSGTSAATAVISGICALALSANPNLSYRDLQQALILSARHFDLKDPDLATNGAGLVVSHNDGFGVPDAALAVTLARAWSNRPPDAQICTTNAEARPIPDAGLRVRVLGSDVPESLQSIYCFPSMGRHADVPTPVLPLVNVGLATQAISQDLKGKAALIKRGINSFSEKIQKAANAGAAFAIIFNDRDGEGLILMQKTDYVSIPAVFISQNDGTALLNLLTNQPDIQSQIHLEACVYTFEVTQALQCEHVGVRLMTDHTRRGDLRLTLTSPTGLRSVLQHLNTDTAAGPVDWTYHSTHHFFESSQGPWTLAISDAQKEHTGSVLLAQLNLTGVPIIDQDRDGLDDAWEQRCLGGLISGPVDDPDRDGWSNLHEALLQTHPLLNENPLELSWFLWNNNMLRLSWPSAAGKHYEVLSQFGAGGSWSGLTNLTGSFWETVWFTPATRHATQLLQLRTAP